VLFLVLLVVGLGLLAFLLRTEDLLQDYEKPEIEAGSLGDMPDALSVPGGPRFGLPSRLEGPFSEPRRVRDPDTDEVRLVHTSWLQLPAVSRFDGGVFSTDPVLDLLREDGTVSLRLRGDLGTLYATATANSAGASLESWTAESFHVTGNVVVDLLDDAGEQVELQILTESILIPGPAPDGGAWSTVECPEPLLIRRPDGTLSLSASSARVEPDEQMAVLSGPIHMEASGLDLLSGATEDEVPEPLIVGGDGELVYRWEERQRRAADPVARIRSGTVTLTRNVHAQQGARWVHGEHLEIRMAARPKPESGMELRRLHVTSPGPAPVRFGLFGGEGSAESMAFNQTREELVLQGPVQLNGVTLEREGQAPLVLDSLSASGKAVLRPLELTLEGDASLSAPSFADAGGDVLTMTLHRDPVAKGSQTSLKELTIDGHAVLALPERSGMSVAGAAEHVSVRPEGDGAYRIQLDGETARLDLLGDATRRVREGHLQGPSIVVTVPEQESEQPTLLLQDLRRAEFLMTGATLGNLVADAADQGQRVVFEPRGPCRLDGDEDRLILLGPIHLRMPREEGEEATLDCEEFRLEGLTGEQPVAKALRAVHLQDPHQGLELTCEVLEFGEQWTATGAETHAVQEPADGSRLELWGDRVVYSPESGAMHASRADGVARIQAPEELLDGILPAPEDLPEARGFVVMEAPSIELEPAEDPDTGKTLGHLLTKGGTVIVRQRDNARIEAWEVDLDLLVMEGRLQGRDGAPVLLRQPVDGVDGAQDEVRALWMVLREQGEVAEIASGAEFRFHLRGSGKEALLRCDGPTLLNGLQLTSEEGVFLSVSGQSNALTAHADQMIVDLDAPLLDGGRPRQILARQHVTWNHPALSGTAALLAYQMEDQALDIKASTEPCVLVGAAGALPFGVRGEFRRFSARLRLDQPGIPF